MMNNNLKRQGITLLFSIVSHEIQNIKNIYKSVSILNIFNFYYLLRSLLCIVQINTQHENRKRISTLKDNNILIYSYTYLIPFA